MLESESAAVVTSAATTVSVACDASVAVAVGGDAASSAAGTTPGVCVDDDAAKGTARGSLVGDPISDP